MDRIVKDTVKDCVFSYGFGAFIYAIAVCATLALPAVTLTGCPAPGTVTNAIATAQEVAQTATAVVADAQAVWPVIYAAIPAASQAAAQTAFNAGLFTANHAILTLDDAIAAATAANTPNPDFTAVFSQVAAAIGQVVSIVQQFMSPAVTPSVRSANGVDVISDMNAAVARLKSVK